MKYEKIDKMSSILFKLSNKFVIKHVVKVAYKDQNNKRKFMHSLVRYPYSTYINRRDAESITLSFRSYIVLEQVNVDWSDKESIMFDDRQLYHLIKTFKKVRNWYHKEKFKDLYYKEDGILKMGLEFKGLNRSEMFGLDKMLLFRPTIINIGDYQYEGVEMFVNKPNVYVPIVIDEIEAVYRILKRIDLYQYGLSMINYLGRPPEEYEDDLDFNTNSELPNGFEEMNTSTTRFTKSEKNLKETLNGFFK